MRDNLASLIIGIVIGSLIWQMAESIERLEEAEGNLRVITRRVEYLDSAVDRAHKHAVDHDPVNPYTGPGQLA